MKNTNTKNLKRVRRHKKIRSTIFGTADVPRLSVFKSNMIVYAQLIDDAAGKTIASSNTKKVKGKTMVEKAKEVGKNVAEQAVGKKVKKVVFDRGGFVYIGRIKAVADGAREGGLQF